MKKEHENRHEKETQLLRDRFESKIKVAKDRITLENSQLIEESTDIDSHILMFKNDLNKNKIQEAKIKM
jgi:hypothetical protein